eukprot:m.49654 g.49654  ORF g.49654 m.49654 type:complete len:304 (-) comp12091_c0_seq2:34-945(-)
MADSLEDDWEIPHALDVVGGKRAVAAASDSSDSSSDSSDDDASTGLNGGENNGPNRKRRRADGSPKAKAPASDKQVAVAAKAKQRKSNLAQKFAQLQEQNRVRIGEGKGVEVFWETFEKAHSKLAPLQLDEIRIRDKHYASADGYTHTGDLAQLAPYLDKAVSATGRHNIKKPKQPGRVRILFLTSAATRAVDIVRGLKPYKRPETKIAHLFAKHKKVAEQKAFLEKSACEFGVGTPHRVRALIEQGALFLDSTTLVVLDFVWTDKKKRALFEVAEVRDELCVLLEKHILPACISSSLRLSLF